MRLGIDGYLCLSQDDRAAIHVWLADHGVDWASCFAVRVEGEGPVVAECYDANDDGKFYAVGGEAAVIDVPFTARRLPDARIMADWLRFEAMAVAS